MYTLRRILEKGRISNLELGDSYEVAYSNSEAFNIQAEVMGKDFKKDNFLCCITSKNYPIWISNDETDNYIMTESGKTFERIS